MIAASAAPGVPDAGDLVPELLAEYGEATRAILHRYIPNREPRRHLYDLVTDYPTRGGRALRPALLLAAGRAFGAPLELLMPSAAGLELLHNAFLIHDDIEDESDQRRGRPALHQLHGTPLAINAGDALLLLALRPLLDNWTLLGAATAGEVLREVLTTATESLEGQATELGWRRDNALDLDDADYFRMTLKKTAWYTAILPLRVGALIASRGTADVERFVRLGFFLGCAFQIQDDLLNLQGDPVRYGKEIAGDLLEGKRTLMLIHVLRHTSAGDRARLEAFLLRSRQDRSAEEAGWLVRTMERAGSIEHARRTAHALAGAARHEFARAFAGAADSRDARFIEELPTWVLSRA